MAEAFAKAKHVTRLETSNQRMVVNAMEPRAAIGEYDATGGKWTLYSIEPGRPRHENFAHGYPRRAGRQSARGYRPGRRLFRHEGAVYPEYVCILHGARSLGRPVKWTDDRSGSFVSDHHGRAQDMTVEIAFDEDAHILALRLTGYGDMGGYLAQFGPLLPTGNHVKNIASVYRTPLIEVATKCVFTNTTFVSAYRGAGRPEGNYYIERALDCAASELGIDRFDLRKRNLIRKSDLPFKAASDMTYDCGDFPGVFKQALDARRLPRL